MPDRLPSCRGAGCCQGDKPEACDCGRPDLVVPEWPPLNRHTAAICAALIALGALLSAIAHTGATP